MTRPPTIHNRKKSRVLPTLLGTAAFLAAIAISVVLYIFSPEAKQEDGDSIATAVRVLKVAPESFQPTIPSQGILEPRTNTKANSEVAGKVIFVSPTFRPGHTFSAGEVLLEIDPSDYKAALARAQADLAQSELNFATETARAEQAIRDWTKLSPGKEASPLTRRLPQLKSAEKQIESARAAVAKAERDLERTKLRPVYDGRILSTATDLGSYVTVGSPLAEFYATDSLEVRLPVSVTDFTFLEITENPTATLLIGAGDNKEPMTAEIIRSEGEIDRNSRSAYIVTRIDVHDTLGKSKRNMHPGLLTPGLFVEAKIPGAVMENVFRVPRKALVEGGNILIVDNEDSIRKRNINVLRLDGKSDMILSPDSLQPGDRVCLTPLESATEGMPVSVVEELEPGPAPPPGSSKELAQP